ncbi:MAG TPA: hemolysin family protein [Tepidisphaeraceae bacterium]|nr:hemolysin family protein [Tepidisphaeraceae bacterium]
MIDIVALALTTHPTTQVSQPQGVSWTLALVPILITMLGFLVAAEYALVASKQHQIEQMRTRGKHRAAAAMEKLKLDPASAIGAIQVCITLLNLLLGAFGEEPMTHLLQNALGPLSSLIPPGAFSVISIVFAFTLVTFLTTVFSELLPKAVTLRFVPQMAALTAQPVLVILRAMRPVVWLMNRTANLVSVPLGLGRVDETEKEFHTVEEIRLITSQSAEHGQLSLRERSLILNSLTLGRRTARQIMVPRSRIAYLDLQRSLEENRQIMDEHLYSRMPLCNGGIDNVIGVVRVREAITAFYAEGDVFTLQLIAQPAIFAPDTVPIDRLLLALDERRAQLVILVDEHGGVEGLVTLRDVVDELVGKPLDLGGSESNGERRMTVDGELALHELSASLGRELVGETSVVTVGGLITEKLGRFPRRNDEVSINDVTLRVLKVEKRIVKQVEVVVKSAEPA